MGRPSNHCLTTRRRGAIAALASLIAICAATATRAAADTAASYPEPNWPRAAAMNSTVSCAAYDTWLRAHAGEAWASVLIVHGELIYAGAGVHSSITQKNDCGSLRKPLQATVLGIALAQGRLESVEDDAMPYWKDPYITPYENDRHITFRQFVAFLDRWDEPEPPGTYHYNNAGATAAGACIAGLFGTVRGPRPRGIAEVARREVMIPLGADWELTYSAADFDRHSWNSGPQLVFRSSVRELAKFGYLWLHHGQWRDRHLFAEPFWREAVTDWSPHTGSTESGLVGHYGYGWFVNDGRRWLPDLPDDSFYAIGNGQPKRATMLLILPSFDAVAVLSMERISDDGRWDVILNSRSPQNDGPRQWSREVLRILQANSR